MHDLRLLLLRERLGFEAIPARLLTEPWRFNGLMKLHLSLREAENWCLAALASVEGLD